MSTPNRSVRKRTKPVREEQLVQIAEMHLEHMSQRDIAAKLCLSQSQVSRDLKEITRRRQSSHQQDMAALQAEELTRIDHIEQTAWVAFRRSCEPEETQSREKLTSESDAGNGGNSRLKASIRTKGRHGSQGYLKIIMECRKERRKLLGMDSLKADHIVPQVLYIDPNISPDEKTNADGQGPEQTLEPQQQPRGLQFHIDEAKTTSSPPSLDEVAEEAEESN